jgi:hypothetical protein
MSLILDGTNGLSDVDGSAATPAIRGSDANTGVFFDSDVVGLSTDGTERVRVDASGNVGIGTSSPASKLNLGGSSDQTLQINGSGTAVFVGTSTSVAQISSNRNPTTGTIYDSGRAVSYINLEASNGNGNIQFYTTATNNVNATERMRIDSSGSLLINTTTSGNGGFVIQQRTGERIARFETVDSGTIEAFQFVKTSGGAAQVGSITMTTTATAYNTSSDYRLKHDIQPMTGALAKVAQLKPVTYKWNANDSESQGFIAHELQEVVPECVTGEKDAVDADGNPQYQGIDTSFLVATLTAAIQELKGINDAQAQIITALTARVEALEGAQA